MSKLSLDGFFSYCKQIAEHIQLGERMASLSGQGTPKLTSSVGNLYYDYLGIPHAGGDEQDVRFPAARGAAAAKAAAGRLQARAQVAGQNW
ncbi:hypothetical protein HF086_012354 [Spodoptera exigua]|uniref:Uncharacterized protein n=1 Tax=Spodoptera exigua TaxID=7107 RepID=A0A922M8W4_SPOEX|nr:hypothetical protein HF086_012354 [Spodoptera exigua]